VKTPFKYGPVLRPPPGEIYDCPSVFRHGGHWYMIFVSNRQVAGYETQIARSDDLLHWTIRGKILPFAGAGWDRCQADGGAALVDPAWGGSAELQRFHGRYWMTYIGGAKPGYEPDPLSIGVASTDTPDRAVAWTRWAGNPVLGPGDPTTRWWERATLYKSQVIEDPARSLGHRFVMYYNGKQRGPWVERIGMAVSDDFTHWTRYGADPVIDNQRGISGDPQLVRMGDLWVRFYFGAGWGAGGKAFDTFACSRDLVHWTKWTGPNLIQPSEPWDATFAHKPWVLKHDGVVYHFYCCVSRQGRMIAVATSRPLKPSSSP
jgi:beta-xylosidase